MNSLATEGIILRRIDYGEADRIITFLTKDYGKMAAMAKGVRRQKSKLAGGVELFSVSELHLMKGRGDMHTLVSTRLMQHFSGIVKDYERMQVGYAMLSIISKIVEDNAGQEYYPVLKESLLSLDDSKLPRALTEISFTVRLLQLLGHLPQFDIDSSGAKIAQAPKYQFDYEAMMFRPDEGGLFTVNHIKILRMLTVHSPQSLSKIRDIGDHASELVPLVRSISQQFYPAMQQT